MCLSIEDKCNLVIRNVSFNIKKLLGYERHMVKNSNISIFLPSFFGESHQKQIS